MIKHLETKEDKRGTSMRWKKWYDKEQNGNDTITDSPMISSQVDPDIPA
jgi:hypothetical protein